MAVLSSATAASASKGWVCKLSVSWTNPSGSRWTPTFAMAIGFAPSGGGLVGAAGAWRFHPRIAAVVGVGPWGPAAAARGYYWRGLYGQLGATPLARLTEDSHTLYGPDVSTGIDLRHQRVSFTAGIGAGAILLSTGLKVGPTVDLGVGVNFGKTKGEIQ